MYKPLYIVDVYLSSDSSVCIFVKEIRLPILNIFIEIALCLNVLPKGDLI